MGEAPSYAILSHTWGPEEVTFADFHDETIRHNKAGFAKIKLTCEQARTEGIKYAWVDTCCINKESSAELSEAINSMFKWYRLAKVCYAYLEDFPPQVEIADSSSLSCCRWFSRGWTLQELIAPGSLVFFVPNGWTWRAIGRKNELHLVLERITRIPRKILRQQKSIETISVAARMSWAVKRQTTREEDLAYCLMGIFNVNMPLLYGEGSKAFIRLQEEILREVRDNTLFAWRSTEEAAVKAPYRGLLACSPAEFADSADIQHFDVDGDDYQSTTPTLSQGRVSFSCGVHELPGRKNRVILSLHCFRGRLFNRQGIECVRIGPNHYMRSEPSKLYTYLPGTGRLRSVTIDKHVVKTSLGAKPSRVLQQPDRVYLRDMDSNVHLRLIHSEAKSGDRQIAPRGRSVPSSWAIGRKMAFEIGIWRPKPIPVEDIFLILFWVDKIPGSGSYSYRFNLEKCESSAHDGDAKLRFEKAMKPSQSYRRCDLDFGTDVVSVEKIVGKQREPGMLLLDFRVILNRLVSSSNRLENQSTKSGS